MTRLAWYVHHVGRGHAARALAFASASPVPVTLVSELDLTADWADTVRLPPDAPVAGDSTPPPVDPTVGGRLHWAPLAPERLAPRAATFVEVLSRPSLAGLVTDVSVEAGLLARLCGVPVVAVHELGRRDDAAHQLGRACAVGLLAPYPLALADPAVDPSHPTVFHAGFVPAPIRSSEVGAAGAAEARHRLGLGSRPVVLVALGAGGNGVRSGDLVRFAEALTDVDLVVVGSSDATSVPAAGLRVDGWTRDIGDHLVAADVVVASAGASLVAEVAAARRPLVCVPEPRPFAEQEERARRLARAGVARVVPSWGDTRALAAAVGGALEEDGSSWSRVEAGPGPTAAIEWILGRLGHARAEAA